MRKCPNCGMDNKPTAKFCRACGAQLPAEAPAELQTQNEVPAARPAAKKAGKKTWVKVAIPALILIAAVALFRQAGPKSSCETCSEILQLQEDLQKTLKENEDSSLTGADYEDWRARVTALSGDIQLLQDHECTVPVRDVKGQEYVYGQFIGSYTGEWRSTSPCGEGVFSGSYRNGDNQYVCIYSGTWSGGVPNGTGTLMNLREYVGTISQENWKIWRYEGDFVNGELSGSGWYSTESSGGERIEYYNGTYRNGIPEGEADFLEYLDGELYDKGTATSSGRDYMITYSVRNEIIDTIQTVAGVAVVGVCLAEVFDAVFAGTNSESFKNSSAGRWLEERRAEIAADEQQWRENKAREETSNQLYHTWQAEKDHVIWCETSPYDSVRAEAEYARYAEYEAEKRYNDFIGRATY